MPIAQLMPLPVHWPYLPAIERLSLALALACSWGWSGNGGGRKRDSAPSASHRCSAAWAACSDRAMP